MKFETLYSLGYWNRQAMSKNAWFSMRGSNGKRDKKMRLCFLFSWHNLFHWWGQRQIWRNVWLKYFVWDWWAGNKELYYSTLFNWFVGCWRIITFCTLVNRRKAREERAKFMLKTCYLGNWEGVLGQGQPELPTEVTYLVCLVASVSGESNHYPPPPKKKKKRKLLWGAIKCSITDPTHWQISAQCKFKGCACKD